MDEQDNRSNFPQEPEKQSAAEIFQGKDVVIGSAIVNLLLSEEIGIPVYFSDFNHENKKVDVIVDRNPGEEDFSIRKIENNQNKLIGIVIPAAESQNEFIFMGITEGDFIFSVGDKKVREYSPNDSSEIIIGHRRFIDLVSLYKDNPALNEKSGYKMTVTLNEQDNPDEFLNRTESAVKKRRENMIDIKNKRVEIRQNLRNRLYGE